MDWEKAGKIAVAIVAIIGIPAAGYKLWREYHEDQQQDSEFQQEEDREAAESALAYLEAELEEARRLVELWETSRLDEPSDRAHLNEAERLLGEAQAACAAQDYEDCRDLAENGIAELDAFDRREERSRQAGFYEGATAGLQALNNRIREAQAVLRNATRNGTEEYGLLVQAQAERGSATTRYDARDYEGTVSAINRANGHLDRLDVLLSEGREYGQPGLPLVAAVAAVAAALGWTRWRGRPARGG